MAGAAALERGSVVGARWRERSVAALHSPWRRGCRGLYSASTFCSPGLCVLKSGTGLRCMSAVRMEGQVASYRIAVRSSLGVSARQKGALGIAPALLLVKCSELWFRPGEQKLGLYALLRAWKRSYKLLYRITRIDPGWVFASPSCCRKLAPGSGGRMFHGSLVLLMIGVLGGNTAGKKKRNHSPKTPCDGYDNSPRLVHGRKSSLHASEGTTPPRDAGAPGLRGCGSACLERELARFQVGHIHLASSGKHLLQLRQGLAVAPHGQPGPGAPLAALVVEPVA